MDNNGSDQFFRDMQNKSSEEDVRAINERIKDSAPQNAMRPKEEDNEPASEGRVRESGLGPKEGLESEKKDEKAELDKKESDNKDSGDDGKQGSKKKNGLFNSKITSLITKFKAIGIILGIILTVFLLVLIINIISSLFNSLINSITNFFGISEVYDSDLNKDGLYSGETYIYEDDKRENELEYEELINKLKAEDEETCKKTVWTDITDWITGDGFNGDVCKFRRYVREKREKEGVDSALIIATIFYGYDTRPRAEQYENSKEAPDETPASEHFASLKEVLNDKNYNIKKSDVDNIAKYSTATTEVEYYLWSIEEEKDDEENVISRVGRCEKHTAKTTAHNLDKWLVYMRFGAEAANMFDKEVLKVLSYESTDDECHDKNEYPDSVLEEMVNQGGIPGTVDYSSVNEARNKLANVDVKNRDAFYQFADTTGHTKDMFSSYNGVIFDYRNGFAYQKFPGFKWAIEKSDIKIYWDDVYTPKEVEKVIQDIVDKKKDINSVLMLDDPDVPDEKLDGGAVNGSGVIGANCTDYLTSSLDTITVNLESCTGLKWGSTTFEDYIIGVTNGEVSNRNDNYVLSQMVASISYALGRRNNYMKGSEIMMRAGNCDQVYCNPLKGCENIHDTVKGCPACHSYKIGGSHGYYPNVYTKYQSLYEIASDYLVISNNKVLSTGYNNTVQQEWYRKASSGMSFTEIINETYARWGGQVVKCSDPNTEVNNEDGDTPTEKVGNKATDDYPEVSEDKGKYYGFSYKPGSDGVSVDINPEWKEANLVTISPKCSNTEFANKKYRVNKWAQSKYEKAFEGMCKLITEGVKLSDGTKCTYSMSDFDDGTVFIEKKSSSGAFGLHAYGLAQDWNYSKTYTINGKTYKPYNTRDLTEYKDFIAAIGGKEESCQNVNYILWKYAYKDAGFQWGGNYGRNGLNGTFDGKLFAIVYE